MYVNICVHIKVYDIPVWYVCVYGNCLTVSNHACTKNVDFRDTSIVSFMYDNNILAYNIILYSHIGNIKSTEYI